MPAARDAAARSHHPERDRDDAHVRASSARGLHYPHRDAYCRARCLRRSTASLVVRKFKPHPAIAFRVLAPMLAHLHEQKQMHWTLDHVGDLPPCIGADRPDRMPALAEDDLTLAFAFDIDRLLDAGRAVLEFLPCIGLDHGLIWQLLRSEEHTSELQSLTNLVCRLLLEKKKKKYQR